MAIVYGSGLLSSTASILASEHGREVSMFARAYMEHPIGGASGVLKVAGKYHQQLLNKWVEVFLFLFHSKFSLLYFYNVIFPLF